MAEIGGLMFRDVKDGDQCPYNFHTEAPEVLRWLCPSLTMAEAAALARLGWGMSVTVENVRRLVLENLEKVRASGVTLRDEDGEKATISIPASGPPTGALPVRLWSASRAPSPAEVAELLRAVEWHACDDMEAPRCVSCGGKSSHDVGTGHGADCKLAAMLRRCEGV